MLGRKDREALAALGLNEPTGVPGETLGLVTFHDGSWIEVSVMGFSSWSFLIYSAEDDAATHLTTGTGSFAHYYAIATEIADGMLKAETLIEGVSDMVSAAAKEGPLEPARAYTLYMTIARRMRKLGPEGRSLRRTAVQMAWNARREREAAIRVMVDRAVAEIRQHHAE